MVQKYFKIYILLGIIASCKTPSDDRVTEVAEPSSTLPTENLGPRIDDSVTTEYDPKISSDPEFSAIEGMRIRTTTSPNTSEPHPDFTTNKKCFSQMPKSKDQGPFYRIERTQEVWRGRKRTVLVEIPVEAPESGLNLCKTLETDCIQCQSWNELHPESPDDLVACDSAAVICRDQTGRDCQCVRSL